MKKLLLPVLAALIGGSIAAFAQSSTVFFTSKGDLSFPFTPPSTGSAAAPGTIRNMNVLAVQGTPAAKTVSATLTAAEVLTGIITVTQGAGAASAQQLPLATAMDTAVLNEAANDSIDFSLINLGAAGEVASLTTNTGWTLVGSMIIAVPTAVTGATPASARFRARKTGAGAWTLYRLS